uniref:Uncharacterized protein n=1 Tax=uncultured marine virus TaxID=186617 RepID=A0A0F7L7Z5_9VIRU|nr:hypothetical protein [uncultured marine virus]
MGRPASGRQGGRGCRPSTAPRPRHPPRCPAGRPWCPRGPDSCRARCAEGGCWCRGQTPKPSSERPR